MEQDLFELSKFLSFALRHNPDEAGIEVDENGWCDKENIVEAMVRNNKGNSFEDIKRLIAASQEDEDQKVRFEIKKNKVRATYGHSLDYVNIETNNETDIPDVLYHGTPKRNVYSILNNGLKPMNRNSVHLTDSLDVAEKVGKRHSESIEILVIKTEEIQNNIDKRTENIYTAKKVSPKYISLR